MLHKNKYIMEEVNRRNSEFQQKFYDFINNEKRTSITQKEILKKLRNQKYIDNWVFDAYNRFVDDKNYKRFIKYVYMYLEKLK